MELALFKTYMARIEWFLGSPAFKKTYLRDPDNGNEVVEVTNDGAVSCAVFVSSVLKLFDLVTATHINVNRTVEDMLNSGWQIINKLTPGAVVVWETKMQVSGPHKHIGFCVDEKTAISIDGENTKVPFQHSIDYNGTRAIEKILWHPRLEEN